MRDAIFSLAHDIGIPIMLRYARIKNKEISVLMFHRISDDFDPFWRPMPVKTFRLLMKELSSKACVIPLEHIERIDSYPDKPLVALSFDDGYADFLENAMPILMDFKLPAHHNICPGLIDKGLPPWTQILNIFLQCNKNNDLKLPDGKIYKIKNRLKQSDFIALCRNLSDLTNESRSDWIDLLTAQIPLPKLPRMLTWGQIRECAGSGIHIGSHGMNHYNMSKITEKNLLLSEISDSKKRIHKETGIEPLIFAFPKGLYNTSGIETIKKCGYKIALLCGDMAAKLPGNRKDFYVLPRINICRANWKEENLRLSGFHQKLKSWIKKAPYALNA